MIQRENDPAVINAIANAPGIREHIDYREDKSEPLDFTPTVGRATRTGMAWLHDGEGSLAAVEQIADRSYAVHLMFASRGRAAVRAGREMIEWIRPYADELWGLIPLRNRPARWFARQLGFAHAGYESDPQMGDCETLLWKAA